MGCFLELPFGGKAVERKSKPKEKGKTNYMDTQSLHGSTREGLYLALLVAGMSRTLSPSCATSVEMLPRHRSSRKPTAFTYRFP